MSIQKEIQVISLNLHYDASCVLLAIGKMTPNKKEVVCG